MDQADEADVVALRFDEVHIAAELANWCGGEVEEFPSEGVTGGTRVVIWVPGPDRPEPARLGDWIVRLPDGTFRRCSPEDFAAKFTPV